MYLPIFHKDFLTFESECSDDYLACMISDERKMTISAVFLDF